MTPRSQGRRPVVHKADDLSRAVREGSGYGMCSSFVKTAHLTGAWREVTCKRCLRSAQGKGGSDGEQ